MNPDDITDGPEVHDLLLQIDRRLAHLDFLSQVIIERALGERLLARAIMVGKTAPARGSNLRCSFENIAELLDAGGRSVSEAAPKKLAPVITSFGG